ncbi:MAG TPA: thioesterase family protein [Thermoleophilaceae bacterium]
MDSPSFDSDTAVRRLDDLEFEAEIADDRWWTTGGPHGGFLATVLLRSLTQALDDPDRPPRSLTVHYTGAPRQGALSIRVTIEKKGRTSATLAARATQGDRLVALALAAFSSAFPGEDFSTARMPEVPPADAVEAPPMHSAPNFTKNFEYRYCIGAAPFTSAEETVSGGWLRLREPRVLDLALAATYADAWTPAIFPRMTGFMAVPTLDLTVHFRESLPLEGAKPEDFVLAVARTRVVHDGVLDEDTDIWSADGRLLVQSRQLAALIPPPG